MRSILIYIHIELSRMSAEIVLLPKQLTNIAYIKAITWRLASIYTAISKKVGEGFVASCIPSPKCTMGDVNEISERSQQYIYWLWEFSQTLSSQYGAGIFSSVCACWHYLYMIHNTFRAWYARCNMQDATKPSPSFFEIAVSLGLSVNGVKAGMNVWIHLSSPMGSLGWTKELKPFENTWNGKNTKMAWSEEPIFTKQDKIMNIKTVNNHDKIYAWLVLKLCFLFLN